MNMKYSVRRNPRAKKIIIKVSTWGRVEVVIPPEVGLDTVHEVLERRKPWLEKVLKRISSEAPDADHLFHPSVIEFPSIGRTFQVEYAPHGAKLPELTSIGSDRLLLSGTGGSLEIIWRNWLIRQGRNHLLPMLSGLSRETGLIFGRATVRAQRTRFGSCSAHGDISLNCRLLFFSPANVRYVLLHELCHTIHHDHSANFWRLLTMLEPTARILDRELRHAWRLVPAWAR